MKVPSGPTWASWSVGVIAVSLIVPQIAFAAWWNPLSWGVFSWLEPHPQAASVQPLSTSTDATVPTLSNDNYYTNTNGNVVHSPAYTNDNSIPQGATARCTDGTYSFSQSRSGTCSYHGGVAQWLDSNVSNGAVVCEGQARTAEQNFLISELNQIASSSEYYVEPYAQFVTNLDANLPKDPNAVSSYIQFMTTSYEADAAIADQKKQEALNNAQDLAQLEYEKIYADCLNQ